MVFFNQVVSFNCRQASIRVVVLRYALPPRQRHRPRPQPRCLDLVWNSDWYSIDLNPVRAGICWTPEDDRWCSYGEAVDGGRGAHISRSGWGRVMHGHEGRVGTSKVVRCRVRYFTDGVVIGARKFVNDAFKLDRKHFSEKRMDGARKPRGAFRDFQRDLLL